MRGKGELIPPSCYTSRHTFAGTPAMATGASTLFLGREQCAIIVQTGNRYMYIYTQKFIAVLIWMYRSAFIMYTECSLKWTVTSSPKFMEIT